MGPFVQTPEIVFQVRGELPAFWCRHRAYFTAGQFTFGDDVDFAMLHKLSAPVGHDATGAEYSPNVCTGIDVKVISGDPDPVEISTSYTSRPPSSTGTNGFSKKVENLAHAVSLHCTRAKL